MRTSAAAYSILWPRVGFSTVVAQDGGPRGFTGLNGLAQYCNGREVVVAPTQNQWISRTGEVVMSKLKRHVAVRVEASCRLARTKRTISGQGDRRHLTLGLYFHVA